MSATGAPQRARVAPAGPTAATGDRASDWRTYRRLLGYVRPYWPLFVLSVVGFFVGSGAEAFFVKLFGDLIDTWDQTAAHAAYRIPLLMLGAVLVRAVGEVAGELLLSQISFSVVHNVRTQLFDQLLKMPSAYFDASSHGHLVSRITYNVTQLRDTGTDALKSLVQDGGKVLVYVGYMLFLSWKLTLIFAATAPLVALVVAYASRRFRRISQRIQSSMGDVTHVTSEAVTGYRVVRIFGGEDYEQQRFHRSSHYNRRQNLKMVATKVTSTQVIQIFVVAALALLIAMLFRPEISRDLSTGQIVTFLGLAGMLANPIRKLSEVNARLQRGLAAAEDIFGQMDQAPEVDQGTVDVDRVEGRIEFRGVCFSYGEDARSAERSGADATSHDRSADAPGTVLRDITFTIEPGQTVALVGRSGSGKSTLASLIPRFYEPTAGEILLDGRPLSSYTLASLRRQIALVTQQVTLFNDTIERNIAYGALENADPQAIREAVRRAHADVFVDELPNGLQTVVGDDGVLLSGGQRQRVAIARALLKDAPVLILDEATSALDAESERHIQAALEEVMRGRSTLVIAHRLSTIERADLILVMEDGRIVESGTHRELLERGGTYAALYAAQFKEPPTRTPNETAPPRRRRLPAAIPPARPPSRLLRAWYEDSTWIRPLAPLSWLFRRQAERRRMSYLTGERAPWRAPVPVVVVGNIAVGGTGKTPLVIWLAQWLRARGFSPGIVSRGYGGWGGDAPVSVPPDADPERVGDEPPLLAARSGVPVVVCADRVAAVQHLLATHACNLVLADDGLQHYALARDVELAVVDGQRGLGNGRCLPAGPLREPPERLHEVDLVVVNGENAAEIWPDAVTMRVVPRTFVRVLTGERLDVESFVARHDEVHAVAGIGNPGRFAETLAELGLRPILHAYPDHHRFDGGEVLFDDDRPVVCTEKDAVKLRRLETLPGDCWYLEIDVVLSEEAEARLADVLRNHGILKT
ncbi:MAG TPA: lipid A export permease/ATP-binding protein MsbA [Pseudomonadales bacterium]